MKNISKYLKIFVCVLLTFSIYAYLCVIVTPKNSKDAGSSLYFQGTGFMSEPANSLDIIMYGNSDVYSGFSPAELYNNYKYTSYASGKASQSVKNINTLLVKSLQNQSPSLIILETDCFYAKNKTDIEKVNNIFSPFIYHSRWKEVNLQDFYKLPSRKNVCDIYKGFLASDKVQPATINVDYMGDKASAPKPIPKENIKEIEKFLSICKKRSIKVLFLELPSPESWSYAKHNAVKELAQKHDVNFLDLNVATEQYKVNMKKDFRDNGNHLNIYGAKKATEYLGKYISENYSDVLNPQLSSEDVTDWNRAVDTYKKMYI